jgi:hypothetical protein
MIEAGGASTGQLRCSRMRARPTGGSHVLTTQGPAQHGESAKAKAARMRMGQTENSAAKSIIRVEVPKDTGPIHLQASFFRAAAAGQARRPPVRVCCPCERS